VISRTEPNEATRRLTDLRRAQPADATLKNLLGVLSAKLAEAERRSCTDVIDRLREHLEQRALTQGGTT
jgi:hypothetical protein